MKLIIPNSKNIEIKTLILDLNGTLTVRGELVIGVPEILEKIKNKGIKVVLFSGDTRGNGKKVADVLGIELVVTPTGKDKHKSALKLNPSTCVAIGNGLIDVQLLKTVKLSILTLQAEGIHTKCIQEADIIVPSIVDALNLLIDESSLISTLRK
ncbi:MAG: HAD family hydrolase [Oligoflexales bacterium]|nr:HAD family hydrolase [Oligoflexales bacterium]